MRHRGGRAIRLFRGAGARGRRAEGRPRRPFRAVRPFGRTGDAAAASARRPAVPARHGGQRRRIIAVPGECRHKSHPQVIPGESLDDGGRRLEEAVRAAQVDPASSWRSTIPPDATIAFGGTPTETPQELPFVRFWRSRAGRSAGSRRNRRRALLVGGAVPCRTARRPNGLLRARRHPQLPHARRARRGERISRRDRRFRGRFSRASAEDYKIHLGGRPQGPQLAEEERHDDAISKPRRCGAMQRHSRA